MIVKGCLALLAGMYALQLSSLPVTFDSLPVASFAGILLCLPRATRWAGVAVSGTVLFAAAVGDVVDSRIEAHYVGDSLVSRVVVTSFPRKSSGSTGFFARPLDDPRLPDRLRLSWFEAPVAVHAGDTWEFELRLRRPRAAANPGDRDVEAWLTREKVAAVGYVVGGPRNRLLASGPADPVTALRAGFDARVHRVVASDERAAILSAIVTGARHGLTPEQWERFARTGTSHLMAISGLHVGLAAGASYGLVRGLGIAWAARGNVHRIAIAASMLVAVGYALVSGFAVPAQRASLMIMLAGLAWLRQRRPLPARILAATAGTLAVLDPLATMGAGFKLSFGAVAVLLWQARRYEAGTGAGTRLRQLVASQFLLLCGLLPIVAVEFGRLSLAAPFANLLAVPVFSLLTVPLALAGLVLTGPLQAAGDICLRLAASSIGLLEPVLAGLAARPWLSPSIPEPGAAAGSMLLLATAWVVLPPGWPARSLAWIAVMAVVTHAPGRPASDCARVQILDVGQGLAAVIETRSRVLVYDTGPAYRSGGDSARSVLLPFLASRGIDRVDRLVVSHGDSDHAGGVASLLAGIPVSSVWYGEPLDVPMPVSAPCVAGRGWRWDGVDFRMLHPRANAPLEGNDRSCVLLVSAGGQGLLLAGDIERPAETSLLASRAPGPVTAVVVPHHGSRTSSSTAFVEALRPRLAIIAAGFRNRWGLPHPEVVRRWRNAGASVVNTAEEGAVGLTFCAEAGHWRRWSERALRRRIWHE